MKHRFLSACLAAAMALTASVPAVSAAEHTGLSVQTVSETPLAQASYDEASVYNAMIALKDKYPDGMKWTNDDFYAWNGGYYSGGYGCAAFAFILSDAAFGSLPVRRYTSFDASSVRVGDILRNDNHSYIVLEVHEDYFTIAEGNINESILWGREIGFDGVAYNFEEHLTRYPEEQEQLPTEPIDLEFDAVVEITEMPIRTMYALNNTDFTKEEVLDLTGLRVNVYHKYLGWQETVYENVNPLDYPEEFTISGFDADTVGEQEITITYGTFNHELNEDVRTSVSFPIQMLDLKTEDYRNERCTAKLELQALPEKLEYSIDEPLDLTGIRVLVERFYSEKKYRSPYDAEKLTASEEFTVIGYDPRMAGEQEVILVYDYFNQEWNEDVRAACSFKVTVRDEAPGEHFTASMEIVQLPVKTLYKLNDTFDPLGLRVNVRHSNQEEWDLVHENADPLDYPEEFTISGFDSTTAGVQEITLTYGTFNHELNEDVRTSVSFTVEVIDLEENADRYVSSMSLLKAPAKLVYQLCEPLDLTGCQVSVSETYASRSFHDDPYPVMYPEKFTITGYDPYTLGEQEVLVIYESFNDKTNEDVRCAVTFTVTVEAAGEDDRLGDINRDGAADAADAAAILTASARVGAGDNSGLSLVEERCADVDFDGDFDAADAAIVLTYAAYTGSGGTMTLREYLAANE